jgi:hypothetical protein
MIKATRHAAALFAAAALLTACGPSDPFASEPPAGNSAPDTSPKGTIRGVVKLQGDLPKPGTDTITQDQDTCGNSVSLPRIVVDAGKGVQNAFVYLEGVPEGPRPAPVTQSILVDQKACQYVPHAMIVPLGSKVEITNSDPILHNVHGSQTTEDGKRTLFNYAQAVRGQRETVDMAMTKPGFVHLTCEAGHPWMSAHMFVTKDNFAAITDGTGQFVIKDVPPGTYTIRMWHEGVQIKQIRKSLQLYEYEEPYEAAQQVTVTADAESTVNFDLTLRK